MSEINDIEELSEGIFTINLKLIRQYQRKNHSLMAKYRKFIYKTGSFRGGSYTHLNLITCNSKVVIPL